MDPYVWDKRPRKPPQPNTKRLRRKRVPRKPVFVDLQTTITKMTELHAKCEVGLRASEYNDTYNEKLVKRAKQLGYYQNIVLKPHGNAFRLD